MNEQAKLFLNKIYEKIKNGEFDYAISMFVSRELIYSSIKARVLQKIETEATPLLTDTQIKDAIKDAQDIGVKTMELFCKIGLIKMTEECFIFPEKYKKLLRSL